MRSRGANWKSGPSGGRGLRSLPAIGRVAAPVVALVLLMILPPAATAAPVRDPAVEQYVESVPGADGGDSTPGGGPRSGGGLPSDVQRQIQQEGGADAAALKAVASSAALGAPKKGRAAAAHLPRGSEPSRSALGAVASAATSGDGNSGGWLIAGIAALTAALAATALARRSLTR
jgi:hypothetical protein